MADAQIADGTSFEEGLLLVKRDALTLNDTESRAVIVTTSDGKKEWKGWEADRLAIFEFPKATFPFELLQLVKRADVLEWCFVHTHPRRLYDDPKKIWTGGLPIVISMPPGRGDMQSLIVSAFNDELSPIEADKVRYAVADPLGVWSFGLLNGVAAFRQKHQDSSKAALVIAGPLKDRELVPTRAYLDAHGIAKDKKLEEQLASRTVEQIRGWDSNSLEATTLSKIFHFLPMSLPIFVSAVNYPSQATVLVLFATFGLLARCAENLLAPCRYTKTLRVRLML